MNALDYFAYTVRLRRRLLEALRDASLKPLLRDMGTNHHSILQTLIHIMAVEESWVQEDLMGKPPATLNEFTAQYLKDVESLPAVIAAWREITAATIAYLHSHPDLGRRTEVGSGETKRAITVEEVIYHLVGEELIHMGEVLAMTRQLGIDLPSYFFLSVMEAEDRPWEDLQHIA
ncbi:MAG: DUF664 domain-containing protein [Chloroflexota bacterium]|nr:DUF664 domain-containing protein [Chloroflexota bacterium]